MAGAKAVKASGSEEINNCASRGLPSMQRGAGLLDG